MKRRKRKPFGLEELAAMADRYAVTMMGYAPGSLSTDQAANQLWRHLVQFGRRVQRKERRR